jgi:hypothetical protein
MVVGGITKEEMNQVMEPKRRCIKTTKVSGKKMEDNIKKILKEDEAILHIIRGLR